MPPLSIPTLLHTSKKERYIYKCLLKTCSREPMEKKYIHHYDVYFRLDWPDSIPIIKVWDKKIVIAYRPRGHMIENFYTIYDSAITTPLAESLTFALNQRDVDFFEKVWETRHSPMPWFLVSRFRSRHISNTYDKSISGIWFPTYKQIHALTYDEASIPKGDFRSPTLMNTEKCRRYREKKKKRERRAKQLSAVTSIFGIKQN